MGAPENLILRARPHCRILFGGRRHDDESVKPDCRTESNKNKRVSDSLASGCCQILSKDKLAGSSYYFPFHVPIDCMIMQILFTLHVGLEPLCLPPPLELMTRRVTAGSFRSL